MRFGETGPSESLIVARGLAKDLHGGATRTCTCCRASTSTWTRATSWPSWARAAPGKTTLLNLLGGLDVPSRGSITVAGDEITHLSGSKLTHWRARHVGFIFQMYNLIPVLSAFRNVELPLLLTPLSRGGAQAAGGDRAQARGPAGPRGPQAAGALGRAAAAGGHRPRHRGRPHLPALRRAHGRPRPQERRRHPGPPGAPGERAREDHPHGHPRPAGGGAGARHPAPRQGGADADEVPAPARWPTSSAARCAPSSPSGSFAVALFLLGLLLAVRGAFNQGVDVAQARPAGGHQQDLDDPAPALRQPRPDRAQSRASRPSPGPTGSAASTRTRRTSSPSSPSTPTTWRAVYDEFLVPDDAVGRPSWPTAREPSRARPPPSASAGRWATASPSRARSTPATGSSTCAASTPGGGPTTTSPSSGSTGST